MGRNKLDTASSIVRVIEVVSKHTGKISFYLHYTVDGKFNREHLKMIPQVHPSEKVAYKEAKAKADAIAFERISEIRSGKIGLSSPHKNLLLKDWFATCVERAKLNEREGMNRHTWSRTIEYTGEVVSGFAGEKIKVVDVDKQFVIDFKEYLLHKYLTPNGQHQKPSTAEKKFSAFNYVLHEAVKEGIIIINPFDTLDKADKIRQ